MKRLNTYVLVTLSLIGFFIFLTYTLVNGPFYYLLINPYTFIPILILIAAIAMVHEVIHYVVGKLCGLDLKFSIHRGNPAVEITGETTRYRAYSILLSPLIILTFVCIVGLYYSPHRFVSFLLLFGAMFSLIGSRFDVTTAVYIFYNISSERINFNTLDELMTDQN